MSESEQMPSPQGEGGGQSEQVQMSHVSARVPDHVSRGVFSAGMIIMTGATEFVLDFIQNIGRPHQVAARIVMPHPALPQFAEALRKNLVLYRERFGELPQLPKIQPPRRPTIQEIYDELKLPDDTLSGAYSNGVMISHSASEFTFDFLTSFFPKSAVSSRVFLSAAQVPRILDSLDGTYKQFQDRVKPRSDGEVKPPENDSPGPNEPDPNPT